MGRSLFILSSMRYSPSGDLTTGRLPIRDSEAIQFARPLPCIADADPWKCTDLSPWNLRSPVFEPQVPTSRHIDAIQRAIDMKSAA